MFTFRAATRRPQCHRSKEASQRVRDEPGTKKRKKRNSERIAKVKES